MRTRLAAGAVGAAVLLTLFGGSVAGADGRDHTTQSTAADTPAQTHDTAARTPDSSPWMHDRPAGTNDRPLRVNTRPAERYDRGQAGFDRNGRFRDNPLQLTSCALGTALGRITGRGNDCVASRYGLRT
ncbi:hypothetical protein [Streptomyces lydicus]|uniref:hypothetical protein n=1 Tax=Streptomyces lydicus TaxID=47763 RepID=UPI0010104C11|nr:hypothetical protein [Streptomyces lydicus]MCZ1008868.1 hypothetical protein [Streptomyces lydicus]